MKIVADGGSTKIDWRIISGKDGVNALQTKGINPYHLTREQIGRELNAIDFPEIEAITEVHFYGAGIASDRARRIMEQGLMDRFGGSCRVVVGDDLLGAAKALFGDEDGIACILGTGSNSGLYKQGEITESIPALGYILGDEGSGADLGKRFLNAVLKRDFPEDLCREITQEKGMDMETALQSVYREALPNRYLASMTLLMNKYRQYPAVLNVIKEAFIDFLEKNVMKYREVETLPIGFTGSVAYHFREILESAMQEKNLRIKKIVISPINDLVEYHIHNL